MILHGPVLALVLGSILVSLILVYAAGWALQILRRWDLASGSELQLTLERRTYLLTAVLVWAFAFQLVSLLLFVYVAEDLSGLFVGAMCAAGTLALNGYGYPALLLKLATFLLAGVWLILNAVDNRAPDYPLVKAKYTLLLAITPLVLAEAVVQGLYFFSLKPDVITSCCGSLFSKESASVGSVFLALPTDTVRRLFTLGLAVTFATGLWFAVGSRAAAGYLFSLSGAGTLVLSAAAFTAYLCLYFYELPTHHCPFCVFKGEYGHVGYPLYAFLLGAGLPPLGVGALMPFRGVPSLARALPRSQRGLTLVSLALYAAFTALVAYRVAVSDLVFQH